MEVGFYLHLHITISSSRCVLFQNTHLLFSFYPSVIYVTFFLVSGQFCGVVVHLSSIQQHNIVSGTRLSKLMTPNPPPPPHVPLPNRRWALYLYNGRFPLRHRRPFFYYHPAEVLLAAENGGGRTSGFVMGVNRARNTGHIVYVIRTGSICLRFMTPDHKVWVFVYIIS